MSKMNMPNMLAYTIQASATSGYAPYLIVGYGAAAGSLKPQNPQDDSYWIVIMDANKPTTKVAEFVVPGSQNSSVPAGLDAYMSKPGYIFAVVTQYLSTLHVPQGAFYDYLVTYGAGSELQKLEQLNTVLSCGSYSRMSYVLTGQTGPRGPGNYPPPSYEIGSYKYGETILFMKSLMPLPNGQPPYGICDSYTFKTR